MRKIILTAAAILLAASAGAQQTLQKQLEVTREYTPRVEGAAKLDIEPNLTDTVKLRPDISYDITPTAWPMSFGVEKYSAANVDTRALRDPNTLYLRGGAGLPLASTADLYFTPRVGERSVFGVYANHRGQWSKIENDLGVKADATEMWNAAGLWGSKKWDRFTLDGEAGYDARKHNFYGAGEMEGEADFVHRGVATLGEAHGKISFGDDFSDLSHLNFRVTLDGGYARSGDNDFTDVSVRQTDLNASVKLAKMYGTRGRQGFEVELWERGAKNDKSSAYVVVAAPRYVLEVNDFRLSAGVDVRWMRSKALDMNRIGVAPAIDVRIGTPGGRFSPFLSYSSRILDGSPRALLRENPYLLTSDFVPTGWSGDLRAGIGGNVDNRFTYKFWGGLSLVDNYHLFVALHDIYGTTYRSVGFDVITADGEYFTAGAELALHNLRGFSLAVSGNWNNFKLDAPDGAEIAPVGDLPKWDATVELSYKHPQENFRVAIGAKAIGEREFNNIYITSPMAEIGASVNRIGTVVDLYAEAEARIAGGFWVWAEGRNLAGQKLYPYNHYRGVGRNVSAGIKLVF